jgi:hypothetical protein
MAAPLLVLGVRRSGTTLLRVMLDRNPELAVPDETYFVPQIADRHRGRIDADAFVDDLRRLPALAELQIAPAAVRERLPADATIADGVRAVFEAHAAAHGKARWGDKTPMYMQHLGLLERLFPDARYVHLIRDGRDACLSFLAVLRGIMTESWAHPRDAQSFACQWRTEVQAARRLGRRAGARYLEVGYEQLVAEPEAELRAICAFAELPWDPGMLGYAATVDVSAKPHQTSLARAPTAGLRDWRSQMAPGDVAAFEGVAGDLLAELGYQLLTRKPGPPTTAGRIALASYRTRVAAWNATATALRRSPLWRRRHPYVV